MFNYPNIYDYWSAVEVLATFDDDKTKTGTGFVVDFANKLFLITARHVVDRKYCNVSDQAQTKSMRFRLGTFDETTPLLNLGYRQIELKNPVFQHASSEIDLTVIQIEFANLRTDVRSAVIKFAELATEADIQSLAPGYPIYFVGFPISSPTKDWLGNGKPTEVRHPLLRQGVLSTPPFWKFDVPDKLGGKAYCYADSFSQGGYSGSPIFTLEFGWKNVNSTGQFEGVPVQFNGHKPRRLLGMMCGHLNEQKKDVQSQLNFHAGLSYFVTSDEIKKVIETIL